MTNPSTAAGTTQGPARRRQVGEGVVLPSTSGDLERYDLHEPRDFPPPVLGRPHSRVFYAAPHVVLDPLSDSHAARDRIDWDATLAVRRHLWSLGLGVAEAMDTAQRGMGLDWDATRRLIELGVAEARAQDGVIACGAGTDQLPETGVTLADIQGAYAEQCGLIEGLGAMPVVMASRALATAARDSDDYERVYRGVLAGVSSPVILHWLGEAFDPVLAGYWGSSTLDAAEETLLALIHEYSDKVDGVKVSVLDPQREVSFRRRLPKGVRLYTGDDYHYDTLIRGDDEGYSDALLGAFNVIAPAAAGALAAMDDGDVGLYDEIMAPTIALSRKIFEPPTQFYKTGVVFVAYLNGHQTHFRMLAGLESARSLLHLADVFRLADQAGILLDPELSAHRMRHVLALGGVTQ